MLTNYRKFINSSLIDLKDKKEKENKYKKDLKEYEKEQDLLTQSRQVFQKASLLTQNHLAKHLSNIVTKAIRTVFFEKDITFKVEFVERRNSTECDMWIIEDEYEYEIMGSRGGGVADISSFALRVAYILLHKCDNVLIIDEPFRNLSVDKHEYASRMIKELSTELNFQFIIATHVTSLKEYANKSFNMVLKNKVTKVY